ncbi:MAG: hypothetical protein R3B82_07470 [Sandaracinaceae bacterium]
MGREPTGAWGPLAATVLTALLGLPGCTEESGLAGGRDAAPSTDAGWDAAESFDAAPPVDASEVRLDAEVPDGGAAPTDDASMGMPLPGGRPHFVVAMFGGPSTTERWVILRNLAFARDGTVTSHESWIWKQDAFTGDSSTNKVDTGYTTAGGAYTGTVRTPVGFEPGASGTTLDGTFGFDAMGNVEITWSSGKTETWRSSHPTAYPVTMLTCIGSSYGVRRAYGFGSQAPLYGVGATLEQMRAAGNLRFQDLWGNAYGVADHRNETYFAMDGYDVVNPTAMMIGEASIPNVCDRWHSYVAGDPARDGRRSFWNQQLGVVGCHDAGTTCPTDACRQYTISRGGGHTIAMLQVLDDDGVFRGWVAAEASLHGRYTGGAVVSASYWLQ